MKFLVLVLCSLILISNVSLAQTPKYEVTFIIGTDGTITANVTKDGKEFLKGGYNLNENDLKLYAEGKDELIAKRLKDLAIEQDKKAVAKTTQTSSKFEVTTQVETTAAAQQKEIDDAQVKP